MRACLLAYFVLFSPNLFQTENEELISRYETLNEENKALKFEISNLTEHLNKVRQENPALRVLYQPLTQKILFLHIFHFWQCFVLEKEVPASQKYT